MILLELNDKALNAYRNNVKGNAELDYDVIQRKMTRNMLLAETLYKSETKAIYQYGSMRFEVKNGVVKWLTNNHKFSGWKLDKKEYVRLSNELGIENVSLLGLYIREIKMRMRRFLNGLKRMLLNKLYKGQRT